jgi:hypothetical protein
VGAVVATTSTVVSKEKKMFERLVVEEKTWTALVCS